MVPGIRPTMGATIPSVYLTVSYRTSRGERSVHQRTNGLALMEVRSKVLSSTMKRTCEKPMARTAAEDLKVRKVDCARVRAGASGFGDQLPSASICEATFQRYHPRRHPEAQAAEPHEARVPHRRCPE